MPASRRAIPSFLTRRQDVIGGAVSHLHSADETLSDLIHRVGEFTLKVHRDRFELLVRSILSQQISTKAARSIRLKLEAQTNGAGLTPTVIARMPQSQLRAAGLSSQKVSYLYDLSAHVLDGRLELDRLHRMPDDEVIAELVAVKGIGKWTAQMFLMFALGRLDVFPVDDLGLRSAIRQLYQLKDTADKATYLRIAEPWRPYSTIASWYVWRFSDLKTDPSMDASKYPV
jgi:DNA-3-methyladenine glycosylase II